MTHKRLLYLNTELRKKNISIFIQCWHCHNFMVSSVNELIDNLSTGINFYTDKVFNLMCITKNCMACYDII